MLPRCTKATVPAAWLPFVGARVAVAAGERRLMCEHAVSSKQAAAVANLLSMQRSSGWCNAQRAVPQCPEYAGQRETKLVAPTTRACQTVRATARDFCCRRRVGMLRRLLRRNPRLPLV